MNITNASQLDMLQNVISPKSSAVTTATLPGWEKFKEVTSLERIETRDVVSKKESSLGQKFTILEAHCKFGRVNLSIEEARQVLEGTKVWNVVYKCSSATTKDGANYLNLVVADVVSKPEPAVTNEGKGK